MRRLFMTGASGFIGGAMVKLAREQGAEVLIYDIAEPDILEHRPFWVEGDVRHAAHMEKAAADFKPTHVVHLASDTDVAITRMEDFTTTLNGTANVVEMVRSLDRLEKFVHVSTQFVVKPGVVPESETMFEPYTTYGFAKAETEKMVRSADLPMPWLIMRPTIIWGPRHPSFADNIFHHIARRSYLHPQGSAPIMRAFGYVENTAHQILDLTLRDDLPPDRKVYYAGDGCLDYDMWADAFSVGLTGKRARRIPVTLLKLLGLGGDVAKMLKMPSPIDSGRAFRMSTSSAVDLDLILAETGEPLVSFDVGVQRTLDWLHKLDPSRFLRKVATADTKPPEGAVA